MDNTTGNGYSARVELHLHVNGLQLPLSHTSPTWLILREPQTLPAETEGTLIVKIDDFEKQERILLYEGAAVDSQQVKFRRLGAPHGNGAGA